MRIPTFSRQSDTTTADESPTVASNKAGPLTERTGTLPPVRARESAVAEPTPTRTTRWTAPKGDDRKSTNEDTTADLAPVKSGRAQVVEAPVAAGPKPRSSALATFGLILGVVSALLVLSGPLVGYGIGVAGLALVLSLAGIHATGRRHVAGKTDAVLGMILALGAIVVGVLALTGSLDWAGTDIQPVHNLREWLDANTVNRF